MLERSENVINKALRFAVPLDCSINDVNTEVKDMFPGPHRTGFFPSYNF